MMLIFLVSNFIAYTFSFKVYQELNELSLSQVIQTNVKTCSILDKIDFYYIDSQQPQTNYQFNIKEPHYAVELYVDFYLINQYTNQNVNIYIDQILIEQFQKTQKHSLKFCNTENDSEIYTLFATSSHFQQDLNLQIQLENPQEFTLGIRNIQLIPKLCHTTCTQCVGPQENQCRSCFLGAQLNRKTNKCVCPQTSPFLSIAKSQCSTKCDISEYYDMQSNICLIDESIEERQLFFWENYDYEGWKITENQIESDIQNKLYSNVVGLFQINQAITYQYNNSNPYQSIRIRAEIYVFQSSIKPEIHIQIDQINQKVQPLYSQTTKGQNGYQQFHIDHTIDAKQDSKITFSLIGDPNTKWGIREVVINQVNCQSNCQKCSSKITCSSCKTGFLLYQGKCVDSCPNFSELQNEDTCKDVKENYPNSDVILRTFDDNIIPNFFTQNTSTLSSTQGNYYGTYYDGKRYFGGLQDIQTQFYQKSFHSLPPHYQVIVQFNILTFQLNSYISSLSSANMNEIILYQDNNTLLTIQSQQYQIQEIRQQFDHYSSNLTLTLLSFESQYVQLSYGISNLNVMIQRCSPLCKSCTGPTDSDCKEWIYDQNSSNLKKCKNGFIFDLEKQRCVLCPLGCQKCSDLYTCDLCEVNFIQQGNTCYCQNGYIDDFTLECRIYA